ncbi:3D domain-containing protein [Candidatus Kaiserbacteria bacterium]|nr:3D domain-containing protein [Candidatus Kaiserbacteria bacterium]
MTGLTTTALMGVFLLQGVTLPIAAASDWTVSLEPSYPAYTVRMTGYNAVPEQTDSTPHITASGAYTHSEVVAARSIDLADELPFGTVIEIMPKVGTSTPNCGLGVVQEGIGLRVVADSMHPRKRNQIDILFDTETKVHAAGKKVNRAIALGVCKDVEIRVVGKIDIKDIPETQNELRLAVGRLERADAQPLALKK